MSKSSKDKVKPSSINEKKRRKNEPWLTGVTAKTNISRRSHIGREPQVHYANYRIEPTNINLILVGVKSAIGVTTSVMSMRALQDRQAGPKCETTAYPTFIWHSEKPSYPDGIQATNSCKI